MEQFPKFIKNVAKVAAVSAIGLMPNQLNGQEVIKDSGKEISVEKSIELKDKIFNEIETGFKNGVLRNTPDNPFYYNLEKDGYEIVYNMDADFDKKKDQNPTIEVDFEKGNSNYLLKKGLDESRDKDIVYNYKDGSLSDSQTKPYAEFFSENLIVIRDLYGKKTQPVNYRAISEEEKVVILSDVEKLLGRELDPIGIEENNKNIALEEQKQTIEKQLKLSAESMSESALGILQYLKTDGKFKEKKEDQFSMMTIITNGEYIFKFNTANFDLSFKDADGNKNELRFDTRDNEISLTRARKIIQSEQGINIVDLSNQEVQEILVRVSSDIHK